MQTCLVWLPEQEVKLGLRDARPDTQLGSQDARKSAISRDPGSNDATGELAMLQVSRITVFGRLELEAGVGACERKIVLLG